jgi:hypothetical protein
VPGRWPPTALYGLHVDCGDWHYQRRVWLRLPTARFTCRHGCTDSTVGASEVAYFTARIHDQHARECPGQSREDPR